MYNVDVGSAFSVYSPMTYRPNIWHQVVGCHNTCLLLVIMFRILFNPFCWYYCNRKALCCSSWKMFHHLMPELPDMFCKMFNNFPVSMFTRPAYKRSITVNNHQRDIVHKYRFWILLIHPLSWNMYTYWSIYLKYLL